MKQIDIAAMGESALKSHASGLKYKDAEKSCTNVSTISTFFSSSGSDAYTDRATTSQDTCIPAVLTQDSSVQPVMLNSIETQTSKELLNVGSCGLHVLHNSFRDGAGATNWNIEHALSSFWWLFKDSPARREDLQK